MESAMNETKSNDLNRTGDGESDEKNGTIQALDFIVSNEDTNHNNSHSIAKLKPTTTAKPTTDTTTQNDSNLYNKTTTDDGPTNGPIAEENGDINNDIFRDHRPQADEEEQKEEEIIKREVTPRSSNTTTTSTIAAIAVAAPEFSRSDSSSFFMNGDAIHVTNSSINPTITTSKSVTPSRKEELLRQAQADRLAWIKQVALPYNNNNNYKNNNSDKLQQPRRRQRPSQEQQFTDIAEEVVEAFGGDDLEDEDDDVEERLKQVWTRDDRLNMLLSTHAVQNLPSITRILSHLYGLDQHRNGDDAVLAQVAARIQTILEPLGVSEDDQAVAIGKQPLSNGHHDNLSSHRKGDDDLEDVVFLEAYHTFWSTLTTPECTSLVQSMRTFLRNLTSTTMTHWSTVGNNLNDADGAVVAVVERVATSLRTYVESTMETIQVHPVWKQRLQDDDTGDESILLRRSIESFLYGHCSSLLDNILWDQKSKQEEEEWLNRVWSLQFIRAKHLELECLVDSADNNSHYKADDTITKNEEEYSSLESELLQRPVRILQSVSSYYSPYEKLQRILAVYRSVNAALAEALNRNHQNSNDHDDSSPKKLPSADDVLPTLILTVLRAKPKCILWNLRMIETFARPEYLRGEAGYAYTNLYGAIQFLQDINLSDVEQSSASLSIPPDEFRQGLEACRKAATERIQASIDATSATKDSTLIPRIHDHGTPFSIRDVRQARLDGEAINLEWALRWQQEEQQRFAADSSKPLSASSDVSSAAYQSDLLSNAPRSYSFLTTRPEEVRVADLPLLLAEYQSLVHMTEQLMVHRVSEANSARKKKIAQQKNSLLAKVEAVESGLVRKKSTKGNNTNDT